MIIVSSSPCGFNTNCIFRCIHTESDLDVEREKVAELHRRFDDTVTGLHELGREHQTLQVSMYRWMYFI